MKIYILIPVYKRAQIFEKTIKRLSDIRKKSEHEISFIIAGDFKDECKNVYDKYKTAGDEFIIYPNTPVSNKFNALFYHIKEKAFDYALIVGSDDLISDYGWQQLENEMVKQEHHYIAFLDLNFYDTKTKKTGYFITKKTSLNKSIGCYRALHKNLLKSLKFKPFADGKNSGIDFTLEEKLQYVQGLKTHEIKLGNHGHIVDLKSSININSFAYLEKIFNLADVNNFPQEIKEIICQ